MNTANIPGFVAEKAIYISQRHYRTAASSSAFHAAHDGQGVLPAGTVPWTNREAVEQPSSVAGDVPTGGSSVPGLTSPTGRHVPVAETARRRLPAS